MNDLIPISALIGDRTYRIKIRPEDEEVVRKALKTINDKILEFRTSFAGKDMQDYIGMVLIWYATEQINTGAAGILAESISEKLDGIEKLLDGKLSS